jgi:hypothetical protein
MKILKDIIIAIIVVALLGFTAFFLINAYDTGKIGNKAEKVSEDFVEELIGTWNGTYSISSIAFKEDGKTTLTMIGVSLDGTYSDSYDLASKVHTLTVTYNSSLGISVTRTFKATLDGDKLTLVDTQSSSITMTYTRAGSTQSTKSENGTTSGSDKSSLSTTKAGTLTTVYNPGIDVFQSAILGKWTSSTTSTSGYNFVDSSKVTVSLLGVTYDGTYSVSIDQATNKYIVKINYVSLGQVNISNSYYATIDDTNLTLTQIGAESIVLNYTKAAA